MQFAVDHAVVNVLDRMDDAVTRFAALGFTVTERGYHSLGSINHLMMFGDDYLELVGIERGAAKVRREVADSPLGLSGLVFKTDDARRLHKGLVASGIPALQPTDFDRPVEFDGRPDLATFTTVRIDPGWIAGGRVYFCQHKTPHLVWQPAWQTHANGAAALAGLTVVVPDPRAESRRYEQLLGGTTTGRNDEKRLDLADFRLTLLTADRYHDRYGAFGCSASLGGETPGGAKRDAYMGSLAIRTTSIDQLRHGLDAAGGERRVQWRDDVSRITVAAASAFDCVIDFVA